MTKSVPEEPSKAVKAMGRALATAIGGLTLGGLDGGMLSAALSDKTIEVVGKAWSEIRPRRFRNVAATVQLAADDLGVEPEELIELSEHDTAGTQLLYDVMEAAAGTLDGRKLQGLARALANGLRDDRAQIDIESLVVRALADLEAGHLKVLLIAADMPEQRVTESHLHFNERIDTIVIAAVCAVLERHNLLESDDDFTGRYEDTLSDVGGGPHDPVWRLTPFGRWCLEHIGFEPPTPPTATTTVGE